MRPKKDTIPMKDWDIKSLKKILAGKHTTPEMKQKVVAILVERENKGMEFWENFWNVQNNKFLRLALWQLWREGKAEQYKVGNNIRFYVKDQLLIFDTIERIMEAAVRHSKSKNPTVALNELEEEVFQCQ